MFILVEQVYDQAQDTRDQYDNSQQQQTRTKNSTHCKSFTGLFPACVLSYTLQM